MLISSPGGWPGFSVPTSDGLTTHALSFENGGIGVNPQGVEDVVPDWVEGIGGYKRPTIRGFEALAVEALRELREANEARDARIAELEARVERLESVGRDLQALKAALLGR